MRSCRTRATGARPPVVTEARRFNQPLLWSTGAPRSFASVDDAHLVFDGVKRAEDSDALVMRLYEAHGGRGAARLSLGIPFESATFCNLLEDDMAPAHVDGPEVEIPYGPFEIVSLKVI